MPDYLDEPSEEETTFFEGRQGEAGDEEAKAKEAPSEIVEESKVPPAEKALADEAPVEQRAEEDEPKVNLGALHESRAQTREVRGELTQARERMAALEAKLQDFLSKTEKPAPEAEPDVNQDPDAYYQHRLAAQQQEIDGLKAASKTTEDTRATATQQQQFMDSYRASVRDYTEKQTDFGDAYAWLAKDVEKELVARGFDDPGQRQRIMDQQEANLVAMAFNSKVSPAERLYKLAQHRGYAPEQEEGKVVRLLENAPKAKTLGGKGGGAENTGTLEHLMTLEGKNFDASWEKMKKAGKLG